MGSGRRTLLRKLASRKRSREGRLIVEGPRAVKEALAAHVAVEFAVVDRPYRAGGDGASLGRAMEERGIQVLTADSAEFAGVASTEEPQGVLLVCREPEFGLEDLSPDPGGGVLVLDAVQDPGNVGTLIRTAWAAGAAGVVVLDGTADPWGAKAVRASAGTCLRIPVVRSKVGDLLEWSRAQGSSLLVSEGEAGLPAEVGEEPWLLVVGNEGAGVRHEIREAARGRVGLPMVPEADSLNAAVAGSILLYLLLHRDALAGGSAEVEGPGDP